VSVVVKRAFTLLLAALVVAGFAVAVRHAPEPAPGHPVDAITSALPAEAHETLERIAAGGPFRYERDGSVFQNREHRLPERPAGYYREFTVETPGSNDRGARRIVTGGDPPEVFYYTDDHYRTFRRLEATDGR
jgi:guanyl-specific ribonuclease Sa